MYEFTNAFNRLKNLEARKRSWVVSDDEYWHEKEMIWGDLEAASFNLNPVQVSPVAPTDEEVIDAKVNLHMQALTHSVFEDIHEHFMKFEERYLETPKPVSDVDSVEEMRSRVKNFTLRM